MRVFIATLSLFSLLFPIRLISQTIPYIDWPFDQEYHDGYVVDPANEEANDIRSVQPDPKGNIWIASKGGIYRKQVDSRTWKLMINGPARGPAYDVALDGNGHIWIAAWNGVYTDLSGTLTKTEGPKGPIAVITTAPEGVYALGPPGVWLYQNEHWDKKEYAVARSIRAAVSDKQGGLWIGTDVGLYHCSSDQCILYQDTNELISAYVRGIDYHESGTIWVGGLGGITIRDQTGKVSKKRPRDGLPNPNINVIKRAPDGMMWIGTDYGISRFPGNGSTYSVRLSKRWLMSDEVRDIAFDREGNAWIATNGGVSCIRKRPMTLAGKADYFYERMIRRNLRDPWIIGRFRLTTAGDTTTIVPDDDDNDGEYNAMYLAMESFRYAATGEPEARERAKKAFDFLHFLREVTGTDGFFARTVIPADWEQMHDPNRSYTPQQQAEELIRNPRHKPVEVRWHQSADGKWKWKGDTSSDELCGHLFGYYCYYRLAADEAEKKRISRHIGLITDHLIRNNYYLTDVDGEPTKWGVWSPESLNRDPDWAPEKALNSLEILSWLKFAAKITGEEKYQQAYLQLIREEGYLENAKAILHPNPAFETYFDIFLTLYVLPALVEYEEDPTLKAEYKTLLEGWFARNRKIRSPLVNFTYNLLTGKRDELDHSITFLKDAPLDLVDWQIDNGRREDLSVVREPILEELQVNHLRPPSEYRSLRWDKNPYLAVAGNPYQEREPVYWLLPYWMARYMDLIQAKRTTKVAAHRGAGQYAPENTLAAFKKAIDLGVDFIEIDIRRSADNRMVILHDATLDRTTNGKGRVNATTYEALKKLSAGRWFDKTFADQTIPSLEELCAFVETYRQQVSSQVNLYVDCKDVNVPEMVAVLKKYHLLEGAVFYGSVQVLSEIRNSYSAARLMPGLRRMEAMDPLIEQIHPYAFDVRWDALSVELITKAHEQNILVFSDGIGPGREGIEIYRKAIGMGIDLIQTDRILDFQQAIQFAHQHDRE
ncbi:MAG: glycerophosphodiester phosphodiesterase family protein [Saprospiraceae bacterium]|nr:hypothetical protein [Lewinella sp.]